MLMLMPPPLMMMMGGGSLVLVGEEEKMGREGRAGIEGPASGWPAQNGTSGSVGDLSTVRKEAN